MKKKLLFIIPAVMAVGTIPVISHLSNNKSFAYGEVAPYVLTINKANHALTDAEVDSGEVICNTTNGNAITFGFDSEKTNKNDSYFASFDNGSYFKNKTAITGINKVELTLSGGSAKFRYGDLDNYSYSEILDTEGVNDAQFTVNLSSPSNYFKLDIDEATVLSEIKITYSCVTELPNKLKVAVFADVQLCNYEQVSEGGTVIARTNLGNVANAPVALHNHFNFCKEENVDVILLNGDIANNAIRQYYDYYQSILEEVYGTDQSKYPEIIWNMGNHEWWDINEHETSSAVSLFNEYANIDGSNLVRRSAVPYYLDSSVTVPSYYKVINGIPFLVVSGENSRGEIGTTLKSEISSWLNEIENLPSIQAGGAFYVLYHYPLHTTFTHGQGAIEQANVLEELLADYPNAIVYTGDTHYPGVNERAINQVDFTTINLGSSSYSRMVTKSGTMTGSESFYNLEKTGGSAKDVLNGQSAFKMEYTSTIEVLEVKDNYDSVINRYFSFEDYEDREHRGTTWTIPHNITKANFKYTNERFGDTSFSQELYGSNGVSWPTSSQVKYEVKDEKMTVKFPKTIQEFDTEYYKITVTGNTTKEYKCASSYYKPGPGPQEVYFVLDDLPSGTNYTVRVDAYDFFENPSLNHLMATEPTEGAAVDTLDSLMNLNYSDISMTINSEEHSLEGSNSSIEAYYKGLQPYNAGATVSYLIRSDKPDIDPSPYLSIGNLTGTEPIVNIKVKVLSDDDIIVGLTVVSKTRGWLADFSTVTQKTVAADDEWHDLSWNLKSMFNMTAMNDFEFLAIKMKSTNQITNPLGFGYVMDAVFDSDVTGEGGEIPPVDEPRGEAFVGGTDFTHSIPNGSELSLDDTFIFDIKFTSGSSTKINFMLGEGWNKCFGYYQVLASGSLGNAYTGISITCLSDGYYRVTCDLSKLNITAGEGAPTEYISLFYIRGIWSDASGYIDVNPSTTPPVIRGDNLSANTDFTVDFPTGGQMALTETFVFDIKFTSSGNTCISFMLGEGWSKYFGYYKIYDNGTLGGSYSGVSITALSDGYYRVTCNLAELNLNGGGTLPTQYINLFYVRGTWSTATGYIDIQSF